MNSKEALRNICYECERHMSISKIRCPFRSISNEFCEEYDLIKKDLEILEILKEHYDVNFLEVSPNYFVGYSIYEDNKDLKKVKEWLENDK